jgi:putative NADH-flavin reductase
MRVIVFGASGRTGKNIVEGALAAGHEVTALVRDPRRLASASPRLALAVGDVLDAAAVETAMAGQDAVLIALGTGADLRPTTVLSRGTANIVRAMETHGVRRVICLLSGWLFYESYPPMFRDITAEHERQLATLRASRLGWVAVCPPQITDGPATGRYRIAVNALPTGGVQVSKADIAEFMVSQLADDTYLGHAVGIAA